MELRELAGQINEQHRATEARLIDLDTKVTDVRERVIKIESTMQTKDACELHRDAVHDEIRKVGRLNKVVGGIGLALAALVAWLTTKLNGGG